MKRNMTCIPKHRLNLQFNTLNHEYFIGTVGGILQFPLWHLDKRLKNTMRQVSDMMKTQEEILQTNNTTLLYSLRDATNKMRFASKR